MVAKAHKALMKDKVLGEGKVDLAAAAQSTGLTTVPLTSPLKGGHAGQVPPPACTPSHLQPPCGFVRERIRNFVAVACVVQKAA